MAKDSAIIYIRVSTKGQETEGESIPVQEAKCRKFIKDSGLKLDEVFSETRSSQEQEKRPVYKSMLNYIRHHRPGHFVFLLPSRLSRNPKDPILLRDVCVETKNNMVIHNLYENKHFGILDPKSIKLFYELLESCMNAGAQVIDTTDLVAGTITKMLNEGHFPGYAPVGYRNIVGRRKIVVDEERAPLVIRAFNMYATGDYSLDDVWERIRREGLTVRTPKREERDSIPARPISRADLWRMLKNPFYTGSFYWGKDGTLWDNRGVKKDRPRTYPPLISQDLYDKVQEIMRRNRGNRKIRTGKPFLYRGLLECRYCGCQLVGDGNPEGPYTYYACTNGKASVDPKWYEKNLGLKKCPQKRRTEEKITKAVEKALADVQFSQEAFDDLRKQVNGEIVERHAAAEDDLVGLRKRRTELEKEIEQNFRAKMAGRIGTDELEDYQALRDKLKAELEEVKGQIQELENLDDSFVEEGFQTLETVQNFLNLFKNKDITKSAKDILADHKVLLKTYFRKIVVGDPLEPDPMYDYTWPPKYDGLEFHWNEPFSDLFEAGIMNRLSAATRMEPQEFPAVFSAKTKKWRGRRDSNSRPPA